ncbi:YicC/YloC family endoribonuclease [Persephonella sp.]
MPYSMTGFAYVSQEFDEYDISVRIKSLNGKGIDISVKGHRDLIAFVELDVRNTIRSFFDRGSFQVFIDLKYRKPKLFMNIDNLKEAVETVKTVMREIQLSPSDDKIYDLASGIAGEMEENLIDEELKSNTLDVVKKACEILKEERKKEGDNLIKDIKNRLIILENITEKIDRQKEEIISKAKERAVEKIRELLGEEFSERAFIEATIIADKMDITEEIVRLKTHIKRFKELLDLDQPVGRKMDFLCQEMHREINTMGNKMPDFSEYTVEMKAQLEKIRQQVQNIE